MPNIIAAMQTIIRTHMTIHQPPRVPQVSAQRLG